MLNWGSILFVEKDLSRNKNQNVYQTEGGDYGLQQAFRYSMILPHMNR